MISMYPACRAACCTVILLASTFGPLFSAEGKPNMVVFLTDDLGYLDSTPYGARDVRTPCIQRLANEGLTFSHAFVASPSCAPSRSALLTGLMPARNGAEANHTFKKDGITSLTTNLKSLGYELAAFGKVAHGADTVRHGFDVIEKNHDPQSIGDFLKNRNSSKPLCLFVGTHEPHVPWPTNDGYDPMALQLPPTFVDTGETREFRARYYTDVTKADTLLGEIQKLSNTWLGHQTLFLFTSDHGAQWPFGKWNLYDAGIRVPLIVSWPGKVAPGSRSDAMIQWIDLIPTLVEAAGGEVPRDIDGRSFLRVAKREVRLHRDMIFATHSGDGRMNVYPIRCVRTPQWKLIWNLHPEFAHTTHIDKALARDGGRYWTSWFENAKTNAVSARIVHRYHQRPEIELYDMELDPFEQRNVAASPEHAGRIAAMKQQLEAWMLQQQDKQTVFQPPRLASDPQSLQPGTNANRDTAL